jgi:uncharacterized protein YutE (UPF0331/DUF86 family)
VNTELIYTKLESLARCLARIRGIAALSEADFLNNLDAQDICMKNLERAVQVCVDVANHIIVMDKTPPPPSMAGAFRKLVPLGILNMEIAQSLSSAVGFRNLAVHEYENVDYDRVYSYIRNNLGIFEDFARSILLWVQSSF